MADGGVNGVAGCFIVVAFLVTWVSVWGLTTFPLFRKFQWQPFLFISAERKLLLLLPLYLLAPMLIFGSNRILNQSWTQIGVIFAPETFCDLIYGVGIAIAGLSVFLLIKKGLQIHRIRTRETVSFASGKFLNQGLTILGLLGVGLWIGGIEELVFRGWIQTQLEQDLHPWIAAGAGSLIFAVAHLVWEGRPGLWQQPGLWLLGMVLVIARWVAMGNLGLAWGLHAGWIWGLACISEYLESQPVEQKPRWLTGRPDQPLTGLLDILLLGGTAGLIGGLYPGAL